MCYNHVISVHCLVCAHDWTCLFGHVCLWVCVCSFLIDLHYYWLDCSHPPIHPIATIATDGAAGINAPGSATFINGRLPRCPTSEHFLLWPLTPFTNCLLLRAPIPFCWVLLSLVFEPFLYPCCHCMPDLAVENCFVFLVLVFKIVL